MLDIFCTAPAGLADDEAQAAQTLAAAATAYVMLPTTGAARRA